MYTMGTTNTERQEIILNHIIMFSPTISQLVEYIGVARPTVYHYLEALEKEGLIHREQDKTKKGSPVKIIANQKKVDTLTKEQMVEVLKLLEKQDGVTDNELYDKIGLSNRGYHQARIQKLLQKKVYITNEGKKFLAEHSTNGEEGHKV